MRDCMQASAGNSSKMKSQVPPEVPPLLTGHFQWKTPEGTGRTRHNRVEDEAIHSSYRPVVLHRFQIPPDSIVFCERPVARNVSISLVQGCLLGAGTLGSNFKPGMTISQP